MFYPFWTNVFGRHTKRPLRTHRRNGRSPVKRGRLRLETLESRQMLSASPAVLHLIAEPAGTSVAGQTDTFTAEVSAASTATTGSALLPAGQVEFYDNSHELDSVTLAPDSSNSFATAVLSTSTLGVGVQRIRTVYSGDANYRTASGTISETVQAATTTTLTATANPAGLGQPVTFVAHVAYATSTSGGNPALFGLQGEVEFFDGTTPMSTPVRVNGNGVAKFTTSDLAEGTHNITVEFEGSGLAAPSTSSVLAETILATSTTTVVSSMSPAPFGKDVTFTATVVAASTANGTPTGTLDFRDGQTDLTPTPVPLVGGTASFDTSTLSAGLSAGIHKITAIYSGDRVFAPSTGTVSQVVTAATTLTLVSSAPNGAVFGQEVDFTVTVNPVAPATGTVAGLVVFTVDGTSVAEPLIHGSAVLKTSRLTVAGSPHTITALYPGNAAFSASPAATLTQVISQASTSMTLSGPQSGTVGQRLVFKVEVDAQSPSKGHPTGTVTFMDGNTTLGTATLTPSPAANVGGMNLGGSFAVFSDTQGLDIGTHQILAVYGGDPNFVGSRSNTLSMNIAEAATWTSLTSSVNPVVIGQPVTYTATVYPQDGLPEPVGTPPTTIPTGSVTFMDGSATLGTVGARQHRRCSI